MSHQTIVEIFNKIGHFGSDIGCNDKNGTHSYGESYDRLFAPFKNGCNLLEIGIAMGDSIKLWNEYFTNSTIYGCDLSIIFTPTEAKSGNTIKCFAANGTTPEILPHLDGLKFDIIIDDGSHMENDQVATFNLLKDLMNPGGIYIIEDILALDHNRARFKSLHPQCEIIDLRKVKGRYDDVLIVYQF